MDNRKYLDSIGVTDVEARQRCLGVMAKYDENHWWEHDVDPRKFAYYQIQENIMLSDFRRLHESAELLLGRPVYNFEFGISDEKLKQEAERAWKYQVGVTSDTERRERVMGAIQELEDYAQRKGKRIIKIDPEDL
jgi:hypothetical protein